MCRTYFEIIVYKYFAIGCCKLCRIVCLLGHILLSYIVRQHFQLWSHSFFYDSKISSSLFLFAICSVCLLFNAFSVLSGFLSSSVFISLHHLLHPPPPCFRFPTLSPRPYLPYISLYLSSSFLVFDIVCYNNTNKIELWCACDRCEQSLEPYDYKLSGAANH